MGRSKEDVAAEFAMRLNLVTDIYTQAMRTALNFNKMRPDHLKILVYVRSQPSGEATFESLGMRLKLENYQLTRIAGWLERKGLASILVNPNDKRSRILKASSAGFEGADRIVQWIISRITEPGVRKAEIEQLCKNIEAVQNRLQRWEGELWPDFNWRDCARTFRSLKKG